MAQSSVVGGRRVPQAGEGRQGGPLGPSDSSDSGSDLLGGPGLTDAQAEGLDAGTTSGLDRSPGAGADQGDPELDDGSDAAGTGSRALADRDGGVTGGADIAPDRVVPLDPELLQELGEDGLEAITGENLVVDDDEEADEDDAAGRPED
ncbi:hypothetical protein IS481_05465 [Caldimonas thermodepolymerans]|jgi:hypothetical protein|uniref:Uncharacterized protein n=1 Tax=Caldimonas thermodepolymerans TaxID=215580 RepID=A0A2S5T4A1_9BURK|nr:hypothetical protein [Caldimonas thermodepolymerans]PPE69776.1 hypothetical protein C1702_09840 [Caldimonas thermodepolymerans]QPC32611.1 hypothetical protein IS481_05465 [Caldimonas thermodepolymerans]RDI03359.1 hypothetical protein DES46_10139 [Caldimonas thermodepolymerans]